MIRDGESERYWGAFAMLVREGEKFLHGIKSGWAIEEQKIKFQEKKAGL